MKPYDSPNLKSPRSANTAGLVFTFWMETAESAAKRAGFSPDRLAAALRNEPNIDPLVLINPYRSWPRQVAKRLLGKDGGAQPLSPKEVLISPLRLRHTEATGPKALRATYMKYDKWVDQAVARSGLKRPPVIITNPFYAAYAPLSWAGPVTYYGWDDWAALPAVERWWPDYSGAYDLIRARHHRVCVVTQTILDRIDPLGPGIVVPNGVSEDEWATPARSPDWMKALPRPIVLYAGAIHTRLNLENIRQISRGLPHSTILIVGPVSSPEVISGLQLVPNVVIKAPVPRSEIVKVIRGADVCIMPHHVNALTRAMSPLKVYEYCAAGRPSVATDLPAVRGIHENVKLVPEGASFSDAVQHALGAGAMSEQERLSFLDEHSWRNRHRDILNFATAPGLPT